MNEWGIFLIVRVEACFHSSCWFGGLDSLSTNLVEAGRRVGHCWESIWSGGSPWGEPPL